MRGGGGGGKLAQIDRKRHQGSFRHGHAAVSAPGGLSKHLRPLIETPFPLLLQLEGGRQKDIV